MNLKKAALTTQCAWRGKVARKELRNLKMVILRPYLSPSLSLDEVMLFYVFGVL